MKTQSLGHACGLCLLAILALVEGARADVLVTDVQTVQAGPSPVEQAFTPSAAQAGSVDVTVVDSAFPVALKSLRVAVTQGGTLVKSATANGGVPASVTATFAATVGTEYVIRVLGIPGSQAGSGAVAVTVGPSGAAGSPYLQFPAVFQVPLPGSAQLPDRSVTFTAAGNYTVTLTDLVLPVPLQQLTAALWQGSTLIQALNPGQTAVTISTPGTYTLRILASPDVAKMAGLFGLHIEGGAGQSVVYPNDADPTGVTALGFSSNPAEVLNPVAGSVSLQVTDFGFPAPLATVGAVLTSAGNLVARQCPTPCDTAADVLSGNAPAGALQLWRYASAGATSGAYLVTVSAGGAAIYSGSQTSDPPAAAVANGAVYTFPFSVPVTGSYTAQVTDLAAPAALQSVQFAIFQGGAIVGTSASAAGPITFTPAAGDARLVVIAQAPSGGSGLFGAEVLSTGAAPTPLLATAQAVGKFSGSKPLPVLAAQAGRYDVTLTDVAWPARFQTLNLFVTSGAKYVAKLYGGGTQPVDLAAGNYLVTYSAVPDPTETAGIYAVNIQSSVPTVTLSADQASVTSGQTVTLTWSSTGATSCTASGAWSGSQKTSGTGVSVGALKAASTFTISCSGPGGTSVPASVSVTVSPAASSGGGGTVDLAAIGMLGALLILRGAVRQRAARASGVRMLPGRESVPRLHRQISNKQILKSYL